MGNVISNLALVSLAAGIYVTTNEHAGVAFKDDRQVRFYNHVVKSTVNVGIPTPRIILDENAPEYTNCRKKFSDGCSKLFDRYDEKIENFLGENLVKTKSHNSRRRRVVITGTVLAAIAIGAFLVGGTITGAVVHRNNDKIAQKQKIMEKQIKLLNQQTDLNGENFQEVSDFLQRDENLVLNGEQGVPLEITFEKALLKTKHAEYRDLFHISRFNDIEFKHFVQHSLTLEINRLPLDPAFLLALAAHCLAQQVDKSSIGQTFCKDFAFHSTRWDTKFDFNGIGFEYTENAKIKSTIYSFTVEIPVLESKTLKLLTVINLGSFISKKLIKRTKLSEFAVETESSIMHPISLAKCNKFQGNWFCPPDAIEVYDECLHNIFNGNSSPSCIVSVFPTQINCIANIQQDIVVVTMTANSKIQYNVDKNRHLHENKQIGRFSVIQRSVFPGHIQCEKTDNLHDFASITIPALPAEITSNITIKMSKGKTLQIKSMHTDEISKIARTAAETRARLDDQKNLLIEKISKIDENLNSTFKYIAEEAKNTEKNIWNSITSVFKPWIYGAAGLALLIMLLFCCLSFSFRKFQQKIDAAQSRTYIQPRPNRTTNL